MDKADYEALRQLHEKLLAYIEAGAPFGQVRGFEIWIEYGEYTTVN